MTLDELRNGANGATARNEKQETMAGAGASGEYRKEGERVDRERLKRLIRDKGYSQARVAELLGVDASTLGRKLNAAPRYGEFRVDEAARLCALLKLTPTEAYDIFLGGQKE